MISMKYTVAFLVVFAHMFDVCGGSSSRWSPPATKARPFMRTTTVPNTCSVKTQGECFQFYRLKLNYDDAKELCKEMKGTLAEPKTKYVYTALRKHFVDMSRKHNAWINDLKALMSVSKIRGTSIKDFKLIANGRTFCPAMISPYGNLDMMPCDKKYDFFCKLPLRRSYYVDT